MAARIPLQSIILILLIVPIASAIDSSAILVSYSFDDNQIDSGPDTFSIIQHAKGTVSLNTIYRFSGYRSVEIRDVAGDRDFPELLGYFPRRDRGMLFAHFAIMTPDPREELNLALAGPRWFSTQQGGIAFWLKTRDGFLCHMSDSIPKKLFAVAPFVWYVVDLAYDIGGGEYDLVIRQEGIEQPIIDVKKQINAFHNRASAVDKFSFIGDKGEDTSNTVYYVDDVVIGVDRAIQKIPFVAPGRKKLFVDYWHDYQKQIRKTPQCLPVRDLSDLGLQADSEQDERGLGAKKLWTEGCELLSTGDGASALLKFQAASEMNPAAKMYGLSIALAFTAMKQWNHVQEQMSRISAQWVNDVRFGLAYAMIAIARGDTSQLQRQVQTPDGVDARSAEDLYYLLLWQREFHQALQLAVQMSSKDSTWFEKVGDAHMFLKDPTSSLKWYGQARAADPGAVSVLLKLSDVYFLLGDLEKERFYREAIYGALR